MNRKSLVEIAKECRRIQERAVREFGYSFSKAHILDLVADQIEDVPLETLKAALVVAGIRNG